jgi:hypothetical protein
MELYTTFTCHGFPTFVKERIIKKSRLNKITALTHREKLKTIKEIPPIE